MPLQIILINKIQQNVNALEPLLLQKQNIQTRISQKSNMEMSAGNLL